MEPLKQFRLIAVRLSLLVTAIAGFLLLPFNRPAGTGVLLGGIAGIVGFWLVALRLEKVATQSAEKVKLFAYRWTVVRMAIYALALYRGYTLDREKFHGLLGAAGGLLIIRVILVVLGLTGFDLNHREK